MAGRRSRITTLSRLGDLGRCSCRCSNIISRHLGDYARDLLNGNALSGKSLDEHKLLLQFGIEASSIGRRDRWRRVARKAACLAGYAIQGTRKRDMTGLLCLRWVRKGKRWDIYGRGSLLSGGLEGDVRLRRLGRVR